MIRGLHAAARGMRTRLIEQDLIANNLANVNTRGFKADRVYSGEFQSLLVHRVQEDGRRLTTVPLGVIGLGSEPAGSYRDYSAGNPIETGRSLDIMIEGEGYLAVALPDGGTGLTRDGHLVVDGEGYLTVEGLPVLGERGPVRAGSGEMTLSGAGEVFRDGTRLDKLLVLKAEGPLERLEGYESLYRGDTSAAQDFTVRTGFLEGSNVDPVGEMVRMIEGFRTYEAAQKILQVEDELLGQAVREVGRVS